MYFHVASAKICSEFSRKQFCVGTCYVDVHVEIYKKRIQEFLPSIQFLNFVK